MADRAHGGIMKAVSAQDLARLAPYGDLVEALREAFGARYVAPLRHHHDIARGRLPSATYLLMPAWSDMSDGDESFIGLKTVLVVPDNPSRGVPTVQATYQLFSGLTGSLLALIDGTELTLRRTACASALGASYLAHADASRLLVVGAGALAPHMVRAHAAVRPIRQVAVWSRTRANAEALAKSLSREGYETSVPESLETAVGEADVISCATTSSEAIVLGKWLKPGVHVDLVGAFRPTMREVDGAAVAIANVFVDTREGALSEGGDLIQAIDEGAFKAGDVQAELTELVTGAHAGRAGADDITLFKSCGTALEDLAAAIMVYRRL
jgi:ornithine cyclodeaminase/alanine dehydrogenase-like protein (mu-crystallin family)